MLFCPSCANMLLVSQNDSYGFSCQTCPYQFPITKTHVSRHVLKRKVLDDVLGGDSAWDNVDQTEASCPKCESTRAYFFQLQIRSADEPMSTFYKCVSTSCNYQWAEK